MPLASDNPLHKELANPHTPTGGENPLRELWRESWVTCLRTLEQEEKSKQTNKNAYFVLFSVPALGYLLFGVEQIPHCYRGKKLLEVSVSRGHLQTALPLDYPYWHFPRLHRISSPICEAERGQPLGSFFC